MPGKPGAVGETALAAAEEPGIPQTLGRSALGYQKMQVGVEINPAAKCLDGRDDPGHKLTASYHLNARHSR